MHTWWWLLTQFAWGSGNRPVSVCYCEINEMNLCCRERFGGPCDFSTPRLQDTSESVQRYALL